MSQRGGKPRRPRTVRRRLLTHAVEPKPLEYTIDDIDKAMELAMEIGAMEGRKQGRRDAIREVTELVDQVLDGDLSPLAGDELLEHAFVEEIELFLEIQAEDGDDQ